MKILVVMAMSFFAATVFGRSVAEVWSYSRDIIEAVEVSPDWDDCPDDVDTNAVEMLFPDMHALFSYQMPSNSCAFGWTADEKQRVFDEFLIEFSLTNQASLSYRDEAVGRNALLFCREKKYINSVSAAKNIVRSYSSPYKGLAMDMLIDMAPPSVEMNLLVLQTVTNMVDVTDFERRQALSRYVQELTSSLAPSTACALTNAACTFYNNMQSIENHQALDNLLLRSYPLYAGSSNRLVVARQALSRIGGSASLVDSFAFEYFSPITNLLMSAPQPLPEVEALRGL